MQQATMAALKWVGTRAATVVVVVATYSALQALGKAAGSLAKSVKDAASSKKKEEEKVAA